MVKTQVGLQLFIILFYLVASYHALKVGDGWTLIRHAGEAIGAVALLSFI